MNKRLNWIKQSFRFKIFLKNSHVCGSKAADLEVEAPIHKSRKKKKTSFPISVPPEKSRQISNPTPKSFNQPIITKSHTNLRFSTHKLKSRPRIKSQNPQNAPTIPNRRNQTASSRLSGSQIPRIPLKNNKNQKKKKSRFMRNSNPPVKEKRKRNPNFEQSHQISPSEQNRKRKVVDSQFSKTICRSRSESGLYRSESGRSTA